MTPLVATTIFTCLGLALALACVRLVRGPTVADRVVALEVIASILIGVLASYAVFFKVPQALDVALVLALTGFLAAIGVSRYLVRRATLGQGQQDRSETRP
ncbi:monovalent cation/H+ antiporter complex subunit F [Polycyclovorans algicola]|uniref:monovalent cation/H+ antiporter complex subunit F n=1 Tax=Polycyclovorans algicola TaxID=616992 RepID=UPI000694D13A|nr:monovalent cation/H+ antiporter complex subunit F [Polycyclovorans algicola]